ncbi:MAG: hypothetical protein IJS60_05005 [Abditibacteriota bacterium]|nr:hypothetical protein [Abditibacteriota bacterium]
MDTNSVFLVDFYSRNFPISSIQYGPKTKDLKYKMCDSHDYDILRYFEKYPLNECKISKDTLDFLTNLLAKNFRKSYVWDLLKTKNVVYLPENLRYEIKEDHIFFGLYNISKENSENHDKMVSIIKTDFEKRVFLPSVEDFCLFTSHTLKYIQSLKAVMENISIESHHSKNDLVDMLKKTHPDVEDPFSNTFAIKIITKFIEKGYAGKGIYHIDEDKIINHDFKEYVKFCKDLLDMDIG